MAAKRGGILCVGIDDGHVKACLCDQVSGNWRLVTWLAEQTPLADRATFERTLEGDSVTASVHWTLNTLSQFMGCNLQHALLPRDETRGAEYQLEELLLTASARPPLRVWVMALTPLWVPRLEEVVHSLSAHVVGVTLLKEDMPAWRLRQELHSGRPDLLLICGGHDGASKMGHGIRSAIPLLAECLALYESSLQIIYAGQSEFGPEFQEAVRAAGMFDALLIPNIFPRPEYFRFNPLQDALKDIRGRREFQGIGKIAGRAWGLEAGDVKSVAESFTGGLRVWQGREQPGADLHGILESAGRRLHVLLPADVQKPTKIWHGMGPEPPDQLKDWPPVGLASGLGLSNFSGVEIPECDPKGFLPLIAPLFARDPAAAWSILTKDLLMG